MSFPHVFGGNPEFPPSDLLIVSLDARQQHSGMTCIEIDSDSHAEQIEYDQARTAYLNELGHMVIRFTNREVFNQCETVLQHIADECQRLTGGEK